MNKKATLDEVLSKLNFNDIEKKALEKCIQLVKDEIKYGNINSELEMKKVIREVAKNEI